MPLAHCFVGFVITRDTDRLPYFGGPLLASAAMDRLLHHAHVIAIEGDSYRNPPKKRAAKHAA